MSRAQLLPFLMLAGIWSGSYTFIKLAVRGLTPSQLVLGRVVLGAVTLLGVMAARRIALPAFGRLWAHFVVAATLGMVAPFLLLAWAEQRTSAAMAATVISALPLLTLAVVSVLLPTERSNLRKVFGMTIGFAGTVLVISPWHGEAGQLHGQLAVLGAAACYATQTVYVRRFLSPRGFPPLVLAASQLLVAVALQLVVTLLMPWQAPVWDGAVVSSLVLLGVFGTGVAYVLYFRLIAEVGATTASAVNYLVPVFALLISSLGLHEATTWNMWAGVVLVLGGLAVAENRIGLATLRRPAAAPGSAPAA